MGSTPTVFRVSHSFTMSDRFEHWMVVSPMLFVGVVLFGGRSSRLRGGLLIAAYIGIAVAFYLAGDR